MISKFIAQNNVPVEHHEALAGAMVGYDPGAQATVLEVINDVIALAKKMSPKAITLPTIPWAALFAMIPQIFAAFSKDVYKRQGTHLEELIELYDQGAAFAKGRTDITTYTQLGTVFSQVAKKLGCNGKLVEMQKLIAAEMTGFTTGTFDREKLVAQLQRISVLLRQVK